MDNNRIIEELSLNQWPALSTLLYDGWILRFSEGFTKRANSINPIYHSTCDLTMKIRECEHIYAANHLPTTYKITPFIQPEQLDHTLEQVGYTRLDMTSVQTLKLNCIREPQLTSVTIDEHISTEWLHNFYHIHNVNDGDKDIMERMLANIRTKRGLISLYDEGQVVACGLGIIERAYIGLYDIVTHIPYRNRGYGEQLILNLLKWGRENGATHSYLAVVANNTPARKLYAKLGYEEIYKYWYRIGSGKILNDHHRIYD